MEDPGFIAAVRQIQEVVVRLRPNEAASISAVIDECVVRAESPATAAGTILDLVSYDPGLTVRIESILTDTHISCATRGLTGPPAGDPGVVISSIWACPRGDFRWVQRGPSIPLCPTHLVDLHRERSAGS